MLTIIGWLATIFGFAYSFWRWRRDLNSAQRSEERLKQAEKREEGLKNAINTIQMHEAKKADSTDIDNLRGL